MLDRRRFLQLSAAAGVVAAASAAGFRISLAQDEAGTTPAEVPDVVTAMAATLGHDLERIFHFVQEDVRYEPYAGILRGANGTLVARAGNSADQAILLVELLKASSIPARFVTGELDDATVAALMATTVVDAETARERTLQSLLSDEDVAKGIEWTVSGDLAPEDGATLLDLSGLRSGLEADRQELGALAARYADDSLDNIQAALAAAGIALPSYVTAMPRLERDAHTWVQANDGSLWLDLDPSVAELRAGKAVAPVAETIESLPDELRHQVAFTVIAETLVGGALAQEPILEVSSFADQLACLGLVFTHVRAEAVGEVDLIGSGLSDGTRYNAVLLSGPAAVVGQRSISIGGGGAGDFVDAFGGGGGEGLIEGETSAEWLEIALTPPGADTVVARRPIFDRIGQAMRDAGVIDPYAVPPAEFVDLGDGGGAQYPPTRVLHAFFVTNATPNLKMLIQELGLDEASGVSIITGGFDATRALVGAELAASMGLIGFEDAASVASAVIEPTAAGISQSLDVWHRTFGTLGLDGITPAAPPAMIAGVIPHAVERLVVEGPAATDGGGGLGSRSVGAVFEAAAAQGIPTKVFVGSLPLDTAYGPEHRERIQHALDAGQIVIAPERAADLGGRPQLGWWLVDPVSGATVDQMDDGGGTAAETGGKTIVVTSGAVATGTMLGPRAQSLYEAAVRNGIILRDLGLRYGRAVTERSMREIEAQFRFHLKHPFIWPEGP